MREAIAICRGMFDNETFQLRGDLLHVAEARVVPRPQRRIPIMIGGSGEKKTLKMVAELADICNIGGTAGVVGRKELAILDEHCAAVGQTAERSEAHCDGRPCSSRRMCRTDDSAWPECRTTTTAERLGIE